MKLTFDDMTIVPKYSEVMSRSLCDTSTKIGNIELGTPLIASPMDTVCGRSMANRITELGGLGILHRFMGWEDQLDIANELDRRSEHSALKVHYGVAVGVKDEHRIAELIADAKPSLMCIDVAHGHHIMVKNTIDFIRDLDSDIHIMAGSICTAKAAADLESWGADSLRVGIGNGSMCETRIRAGVGVPQVNAIIECKDETSISIISDGGCRTTGDVAKAIALGADAVMIGSLFAGTKETPGHIQKMGQWPNEQLFKKYQGSASIDSKIARGEINNVEGNSRIIPYKGKVKRIVNDINDGLRSAMSYVGANNIEEFQKNASFVQVSQAGQIEAKPHGLI